MNDRTDRGHHSAGLGLRAFDPGPTAESLMPRKAFDELGKVALNTEIEPLGRQGF